MSNFYKFPRVHIAGNEYPTLFRAREGEGGEGEEWHPTSVTPYPTQGLA